jgi:hypothetical protein
MQPNMQFTFSDTIAGYVTSYNWDKQSFSLDTSDGRSFDIALTPTTSAEGVRNFGEDYVDYTGQMRDMLVPDRYVYVYGSFYPEGGKQPFEAERLIFLGKTERGYRFEEPDWWVNMIRFLGDFWLKAQFPDGIVDYRNYRTRVSLSGIKLSGHTEDFRQETDTISRTTSK